MCRPTTCNRCGDTTWAGCGQHVDQVMARVPADRRCTCDGRAAAERNRTGGRAPGRRRGLFRR